MDLAKLLNSNLSQSEYLEIIPFELNALRRINEMGKLLERIIIYSN